MGVGKRPRPRLPSASIGRRRARFRPLEGGVCLVCLDTYLTMWWKSDVRQMRSRSSSNALVKARAVSGRCRVSIKSHEQGCGPCETSNLVSRIGREVAGLQCRAFAWHVIVAFELERTPEGNDRCRDTGCRAIGGPSCLDRAL